MCEYYEINALRSAEQTFSADMSEQYKRFLPLLREQARILDVGSGSGRDACYFLEFTEQLVEEILSVNRHINLKKLWYTEDVSGRKGFQWMNIILKRM